MSKIFIPNLKFLKNLKIPHIIFSKKEFQHITSFFEINRLTTIIFPRKRIFQNKIHFNKIKLTSTKQNPLQSFTTHFNLSSQNETHFNPLLVTSTHFTHLLHPIYPPKNRPLILRSLRSSLEEPLPLTPCSS